MDRAALPVAAGLLAGLGGATFAATILAVALGSLTPAISALGLAAGALLGAAVGRGVARAGAPSEAATAAGWADVAAAGLFGAIVARQFLGLHAESQGEVLTLDVLNYGDLPLHISYIRYFAAGTPFWPENPAFTGARLQYPIGIDVWNAMLLQVGVPLAAGLVGTGLLASLFSGLALWRWSGSFAILAFLFSGGIGATDDLAWKNLFLALFVTQRGFLFALPVGLLLLESWRRRFLADTAPTLPAWVEGVLWGIMPVFHLHTFLVLSLLYALWALVSRRVRRAAPALVVAIVPGTTGVLLVTDSFRAASLLGWKPGWTIGDDNPLVFLALNFTLYPLLLFLAGRRAWRDGDRAARWLLIPALGLWVALFFVRLAPWAWDNTKVMLWCYLLTLPAIATALERLAGWLRGALVAVWLLPGMVWVSDATLDPRHGYSIYDSREVEAVCAALREVPVTARIAVWPTFNHPVALCGRPLVAGYGGHLWTYGLDPRYVSDRLQLLMNGGEGWEGAARDVRAEYLFWGPREAQEWRHSRRPWEGARRIVASGPWGRLYAMGSSK